jgi:hypothetical protein
MTAPTQKPDKRGFRFPRAALLTSSACVVFLVFAVALLRVLRPPHTRADYLIIGSLATLAALITIFAGLVLGSARGRR